MGYGGKFYKYSDYAVSVKWMGTCADGENQRYICKVIPKAEKLNAASFSIIAPSPAAAAREAIAQFKSK